MGYKTFEDMKHCIPEGATHYHNESDGYLFCWFKIEGGKWFALCPDEGERWHKCNHEHHRSGIIQFLQTESPEEREALDMIDTTLEQVNSLAKDDVVEWKAGDECIYNGELYVYQCVASWDSEACILSGKSRNSRSLTDAWIDEISKPESPEQKAERERLEAVKEMCEDVGESLYKGAYESMAALYDAGYRKQ